MLSNLQPLQDTEALSEMPFSQRSCIYHNQRPIYGITISIPNRGRRRSFIHKTAKVIIIFFFNEIAFLLRPDVRNQKAKKKSFIYD
jgi:hypothetical protein